MPESNRPTLYDFVVHNALLLYSAGEQAGSKAQDSFVLSAESPIFASAKDVDKDADRSADHATVTAPVSQQARVG